MISIKDLVAHVAGQENPMLSSDALVTGIAEAATAIVNRNDRDMFVKDLLNNVPALRAALVHVPGKGATPVGVAPPEPPPPPPVNTARTANEGAAMPPSMDPHQRLEELGQMWDAMKQKLDALSALVEKYVPLNGAPAVDPAAEQAAEQSERHLPRPAGERPVPVHEVGEQPPPNGPVA
jgi:hypothetical protein